MIDWWGHPLNKNFLTIFLVFDDEGVYKTAEYTALTQASQSATTQRFRTIYKSHEGKGWKENGFSFKSKVEYVK